MSAALPKTSAAPAEIRAAGTDLSERRRSGVSRGPLIDIRRDEEKTRIARRADGARIGALVTIAHLAADSDMKRAYPGLTAAAGGLATPQIRRVGTIGGNLAQRSRCWYYRNPHTPCLKKGGAVCPAREGNHLYGVIFDRGPCVAPHPSTLGAALLAYDARVATTLRNDLAIAELFGDGSDGTRENGLAPGEEILAIHLPPAVTGERGAYHRAISRAYAEWPLVEAVAGIVSDQGLTRLARIAVGGVAPVPLRLPTVEAALTGQPFDDVTIGTAARQAIIGAKPLAMTGYKIDLLAGLIVDVLGRIKDTGMPVAER